MCIYLLLSMKRSRNSGDGLNMIVVVVFYYHFIFNLETHIFSLNLIFISSSSETAALLLTDELSSTQCVYNINCIINNKLARKAIAQWNTVSHIT